MEAVRVLLWEANPHTREDLCRLFALCDELRLVGDCETLEETRAALKRDMPQVLLLSLGRGGAEQLDELFEGMSELPTLVLLANPRDRRAWREAMAHGVKHFLATPFSADEVVELILSAHGATLRRSLPNEDTTDLERPRGRIVSIFSSKGGVGKTSLLVNLATRLARDGVDVALADLDLPFGDVGAMMGLRPRRGLSDLMRELPPWTADLVAANCVSTEEGVCVLPSVSAPEHVETLEVWQFQELLRAMARRHALVLVDSSANFGPLERAVLAESDRILLLVSPERTTVKNVGFCIAEARRLGIDEGRFTLLVNRGHPPTGGLEPEVIADELGCELGLVIPSGGRRIVESVNLGRPYMSRTRRCGYAKAVKRLADMLGAEGAGIIRRPGAGK